jgi:hypothetical protein
MYTLSLFSTGLGVAKVLGTSSLGFHTIIYIDGGGGEDGKGVGCCCT